MIPRGKLYISYKDLVSEAYYYLTDKSRKRDIDQDTGKLICLSVRTGFDLILSTLNLD